MRLLISKPILLSSPHTALPDVALTEEEGVGLPVLSNAVVMAKSYLFSTDFDGPWQSPHKLLLYLNSYIFLPSESP